MQIQATREGYFFNDFSGTKFQVADICFARNTMTEAKILAKYVNKKKQIVFELNRQKKYESESRKQKSQKKIDKMN